MKLLTLNCHSWQETNQIEKIEQIAKVIKEKFYDVVALQEVSQLRDEVMVDHRFKKNNFLLLLLNKLREMGVTEYDGLWDFSHIGFDIYEEGLALLSRHRILQEHSFYVSRSENSYFWKSRRIVGKTLEIEGKAMDFYSCHLGWWGDNEEPFNEQVDRLFEKVPFNKPTFFMGDFNNDGFTKKEGYEYMINKGLYDTFALAKEKDRGVTFGGNIRIDYILTNEKRNVISSKTIFNGKNGPRVSDHYGVEVELIL